jgi:uncharacterized Zn finger protein
VVVKMSEVPETDDAGVTATPLQAMFDEASCSALAGPAAFLRGVSLALHGAVSDLRLRPDSASGSVSSEIASADGAAAGATYEVRLLALLDQADRPAGSSYTCSCTRGSGGALCAHAVAVALVATGSVDPDATDGDASDSDGPHPDGGYDTNSLEGELAEVYIDPVAVQEFLLALSRAELVDLVLDLAEVNDGLADDLRATAARWHRPAADV